MPVANLWKTLDTIKIEQLGKYKVQIGERFGSLCNSYKVPSIDKNLKQSN
jgi:hypothetical protein